MVSKFPRNGVGLCLALFFLFAAVLACSRGNLSKCTATLTYQGKTYTGGDKESDTAVSNACNKYCRDDDPEYDAMYRIWLDSAEGRAAGRPPKEEAIYKSKGLLDFVTITARTGASAGPRVVELKQKRSVISLGLQPSN